MSNLWWIRYSQKSYFTLKLKIETSSVDIIFAVSLEYLFEFSAFSLFETVSRLKQIIQCATEYYRVLLNRVCSRA